MYAARCQECGGAATLWRGYWEARAAGMAHFEKHGHAVELVFTPEDRVLHTITSAVTR